MRGGQLAVAAVVVLLTATGLGQVTPPGAEIPDVVEGCLAEDAIGACFVRELGQAPSGAEIPGPVQDCLDADDIGACFAGEFGQAPPAEAGIPDFVADCLAEEDALDRAACFTDRGGGG